MEKYYLDLVSLSRTIEKRINSTDYPILSTIFDHKYFEYIRLQIKEMSIYGNTGPVHSMAIAMRRNEEDKGELLNLFEKYLHLIFNHPTVKKHHITYIKTELVSQGCINTMFEVSILGNLLTHIDNSKIKLYSRTTGLRDVEAEIELFNRSIYIEVSVLGESKGDMEIRNKMMKMKKNVWSGSRDMEHDTARFKVKVEEKTKQFLPNKPNVLILCTFDIFPIDFEIKAAMRNNFFNNVGLLLRFKREELKNIFTPDKTCYLNKDEIIWLKDFFTGDKYKPLTY